MAMPGAWAAARRGRATAIASASLGVAIGGDDHAHHHEMPVPSGSLVSPMNPLEGAGTLRATWSLARGVAAHALTAIAVPIGDGTTYAIAGVGATWQRGAWALLADAQLGIVGEPFRSRALLGIARSF
jgi:hypothetical protein